MTAPEQHRHSSNRGTRESRRQAAHKRYLIYKHTGPTVEENGTTDDEATSHAIAVAAIVQEEFILRQQLPCLADWVLAASYQVLTEAYAQALTSLLKDTPPPARKRSYGSLSV